MPTATAEKGCGGGPKNRTRGVHLLPPRMAGLVPPFFFSLGSSSSTISEATSPNAVDDGHLRKGARCSWVPPSLPPGWFFTALSPGGFGWFYSTRGLLNPQSPPRKRGTKERSFTLANGPVFRAPAPPGGRRTRDVFGRAHVGPTRGRGLWCRRTAGIAPPPGAPERGEYPGAED